MAQYAKILQNIYENSEDFIKCKFYLQNIFRFLYIFFFKKIAFFKDNLKIIFSGGRMHLRPRFGKIKVCQDERGYAVYILSKHIICYLRSRLKKTVTF